MADFKDGRTQRYSIASSPRFRGKQPKSSKGEQDRKVGIEARRNFRGFVAFQRDQAEDDGDEETDVQRELLETWAERARAKTEEASALPKMETEVPVVELVVGTMKEKIRAPAVAGEADFEVVVAPSIARVLALPDDAGAAVPEPQEDWDYIDDDFVRGDERQTKPSASYAEVLTEGKG
ncbi:hypothetical protein EXIGLDRAFT_743942 [Exidia glandulosa HHB12029]|uniref:Uncharacterized protein n=1 Tax=Exidia glandulosa HHB12029 TaxID=1314781 RepID=A0A165QEW3_EXIGL|nr:hypothetical protein EXIGLDRAFT_743942 [Exidia glandulosa HHB12029]